GPNIKPFPLNVPLEKSLEGEIVLKVEDNITTDHIMPSNAKLLPYRSNIPYLANYCFSTIDEEFPKRALDNGGGFILGGDNYGQGSSREHAALAPLYLGIRAVLVKSFARIHKANLINSGIIPMTFNNLEDYERIDQMDSLEFPDIYDELEIGVITARNINKNYSFKVNVDLSKKDIAILKAGGTLNYNKKN
ncbi:MAG: aconitate hydratase, partial [Sarcina sp.]